MSKQREDFVFIQGSAKEPEFPNGSNNGDLINLQINVEQLVELVKANPTKHANGYVHLTLRRKKVPNEYSTHFLHEDTYQPKPKDQNAATTSKPSKPMKPKYVEPEEEDDLPFR